MFDDAINHYQVEEQLTSKEYNQIAEAIRKNGKSGSITSIQAAFDDYDQFDQQNNSAAGEGSSSYRLSAEHDRENKEVLRVAQGEASRRDAPSDGHRDRASRGEDRQGRNVSEDTQYSLRSNTDSQGRALTPEQRKFFKDSKVVDKDGRLLVVYHGTNAVFNTFDYFKTKGGKLGYGFYFSNNKYFAANYIRQGEGKLVSCYLNIKNPFIIEETVLTNEQIDQMLERLDDTELKKDNETRNSLFDYNMKYDPSLTHSFLTFGVPA